MSRIDKTLASVDWIDHFRNVSQRVLPEWFLIIAHYWWLLVVLIKVKVLLSLRICG